MHPVSLQLGRITRCSSVALRAAVTGLSLAILAAGCSDTNRLATGPSAVGGSEAKPPARLAGTSGATTVSFHSFNSADLTVVVRTKTSSTLASEISNGTIRIHIRVADPTAANPVPVGCDEPGEFMRLDTAATHPAPTGVSPGVVEVTFDLDNLPKGVAALACGDTICIKAHYVTGGGPSHVNTHWSGDPTVSNGTPESFTLVCAENGCSHGYWKNHEASWEGYASSSTLGSAFAGLAAHGLADTRFDTALDFGGGPTLTDKIKILMRNAVASLLNAAHSGVNYPMTTAGVIAAVNAAIASGSAATVLALEEDLDAKNNLGCPLN